MLPGRDKTPVSQEKPSGTHIHSAGILGRVCTEENRKAWRRLFRVVRECFKSEETLLQEVAPQPGCHASTVLFPKAFSVQAWLFLKPHA
jgi:hypothetical protein